jgi:hypothetical protein
MTADVRVADTTDLREAVYRFRYDVYVREMGRSEPYADHTRRRLTDPMDETAVIVAAVDAQGDIIGTLRTNPLQRGGTAHYEHLYGIDALPACVRNAASITTRLMVSRCRRGSALVVRLAAAAWGAGLGARIQTDFIDCNAHLVPFFTRLGYRAQRTIHHPQYGAVTVMRLDVFDHAHLIDVRSPLRRLVPSATAMAPGRPLSARVDLDREPEQNPPGFIHRCVDRLPTDLFGVTRDLSRACGSDRAGACVRLPAAQPVWRRC